MAGAGLGSILALVSSAPIGRLLVVAPPLLALILNWGHGSRAENTLARDFAGAMLERAESGALILAEDDVLTFPLLYLHRVERRRPDLRLVLLGVDGLDDLRFDVDSRPHYSTHYRQPAFAGVRPVLDGPFYRLEWTGIPSVPKHEPVTHATAMPLELRAPLAVSSHAMGWRLESFENIPKPWLLRYSDRALVSHYWQLRAAALESADPQRAAAAARLVLRLDPDHPSSRHGAEALLARLARPVTHAE